MFDRWKRLRGVSYRLIVLCGVKRGKQAVEYGIVTFFILCEPAKIKCCTMIKPIEFYASVALPVVLALVLSCALTSLSCCSLSVNNSAHRISTRDYLNLYCIAPAT